MKNIFLLPTYKPSMLVQRKITKDLKLSSMNNHQLWDNRNIYITSDENIKEGDYGLGFAHGIKGAGRGYFVFKQDGTNVGKVNALCSESKKIILTTDPDLIKDGVQTIDDEFLEWFIKNPNCEFVDFEKEHDDTVPYPKMRFCKPYKIINQKEESFKHQAKVLSKEEVMDNRSSAYEFIDFNKQETIEEAAENYGWRIKRNTFSNAVKANELAESAKQDFLTGAKWQSKQLFKDDVIQTLEKGIALLLKKQEQMYSEEELKKVLTEVILINPSHLSLLRNGYGEFPDSYKLTENGVNYIIEQLKNK